MIRAMVVDDEAYARQGLSELLAPMEGITVVAQAASGAEALEQAPSVRPEVVFLDIRMPGMDGFAVIDEWPDPLPRVVFVTAYDDRAVEAFAARALDYLLKPVTEARLEETLERLRRNRQTVADRTRALERLLAELHGHTKADEQKWLQRVSIRSHRGEEYLDLAEVDWIEAQNYYAAFHAGERTLLAKVSLKRLERELDPGRFVRIHRSTIAAVEFIERLEAEDPGQWLALFKDGTRRRVSRSGRLVLADRVPSLP